MLDIYRPMRSRVEGVGDSVVIELFGELDLHEAHRLEEILATVQAQETSSIVLDLTGVSFIDSCGLRPIINAAGRAWIYGGTLSLRGIPTTAHTILRFIPGGDLLDAGARAGLR